MILFRCWKCHRKHEKNAGKIGTTFSCGGCQNILRVPRKDHGYCRVRSWADFLVELLLCGGGGALLGLGLGVVMVSRMYAYFVPDFILLMVVLGCSLAGFLAGTFGGTRGIDWIGRKIREREQG